MPARRNLRAEEAGGALLEGMNDLVLSRELVASAIRYRVWCDSSCCARRWFRQPAIATPFGSRYFQSITHGNSRRHWTGFQQPMVGANFTVLPPDTKSQ